MGSSSFGNYSAINIIQFFTILLVLVTSQPPPPPPPPFSSSPPALSITTDKEALLSLKSQFLVEIPNNPLSTWDQQNLSPCNWSGVSCTEQRVTGLDLSGLRMAGSISPYLGNLSSLRSLHLQNNQLTGKIPLTISGCRDLMTLELMQNRIWGRIPHEISQLMQLQILNLAGNQLSGEIPSSLTNISSLVDLNLRTNNLGGSIPSDLWRLSNLKLLDLTINNLSGRVPLSLYNMSALVYVALASNNFWGELPPDIGITLPNLLGLNFCFNRFTDNFGEENLIGHGSFGFVYRGVVQGVTMAVKVLNTAVAKPRKTFLAECGALRYLRHRNLVKLVTACSSLNSKNEEFFALVFEFMSNGSLDDWITGKRKHANGIGMTASDRLKYAIGIASAIDYLHNETEVPIVHCDLKPSNVLLDSDMTPKVADFGLAKLLLDDTDNHRFSISCTHTLRGSIGYIPPEYGYGERPSTAGDVYSYGILLLELFTGKSPTCEIFTEDLTLKSWVEKQFPTDVEKVLELDLVEEMNDYWEDEEEGRDCGKLESWRECLTAVVGIGLSCAAESADARMSIIDALRKLKNVEEILDKHRRLVDDGETIYIDS
ncbi:PREDICTED: putative receptor-like protein kinase At3g47110 [Erythranthe guttata]|uniref:putative receptor-like protein kinase At3g47110 n=1 Tax=Erythranthe guttata TaxID=4155 RepID=UPI00064DDFC0|nr:PREDICTED: putative receptor-like protein kinase At3g47110 [Erythranthe guttata]|eukprot:XP_012841014.1 PREDICTED: putative receptor-like protein kinase At3g47110 [Erythranthe guttata]